MFRFGYLGESNSVLNLKFFEGTDLEDKDVGKEVIFVVNDYIAVGWVVKNSGEIRISEEGRKYESFSIPDISLVAYDTTGLNKMINKVRGEHPRMVEQKFIK